MLISKAVDGANGIIIYPAMLLLLCDHGMIHNIALALHFPLRKSV